jgi:hypothetical protein
MDGGAAHGLDDPDRLTGARILPGQLAPHRELVVHHVLQRQVVSRLQANDFDALLAKLVGERAAAGSRADHHDDARVIQFVFGSHVYDFPSESVHGNSRALDLQPELRNLRSAERMQQDAALSHPST